MDSCICPQCLTPLPEARAVCPFCGQHFAGVNPEGSLPYGTVLDGRYTIGKYEASDGEGLLYQAVQNDPTKRVVIKEYYPLTLSSIRSPDGHIEPKEGSEVLFKTNRMDFADLYRSLMRITPTPGLATVLDVVEANNTAYGVLETLQGLPLDQYRSLRGGSLSVSEAVELMQPVMEGVAELHKTGMIHRGIAPENIFISSGGKASLAGYATLGLRTEGSELRARLYEGYSAPEQYSAAEFEGRYTDVYGLAAVLYWLLTGKRPLSAALRRHGDELPGVRTLRPEVPAYLSDLLDAALCLDPEHRLQNVPELICSIKSENETHAVLSRGKKPEPAPLPPPKKRSRMGPALVLLTVAACLLAWAVLGAQGEHPDSQQVPSAPVQELEELTVPSLMGMTFSQIENNREYTTNFSFALSEEHSATVEKGKVIRQDPVPGAHLSQEESHLIWLYVSKGPELTEMPNIIGFTKENASSELLDLGIDFTIVEIPNNGQYVGDCVVYTSIRPGDKFDPAEELVTVHVAAVEPDEPEEPAEEPDEEESGEEDSEEE